MNSYYGQPIEDKEYDSGIPELEKFKKELLFHGLKRDGLVKGVLDLEVFSRRLAPDVVYGFVVGFMGTLAFIEIGNMFRYITHTVCDNYNYYWYLNQFDTDDVPERVREIAKRLI